MIYDLRRTWRGIGVVCATICDDAKAPTALIYNAILARRKICCLLPNSRSYRRVGIRLRRRERFGTLRFSQQDPRIHSLFQFLLG